MHRSPCSSPVCVATTTPSMEYSTCVALHSTRKRCGVPNHEPGMTDVGVRAVAVVGARFQGRAVAPGAEDRPWRGVQRVTEADVLERRGVERRHELDRAPGREQGRRMRTRAPSTVSTPPATVAAPPAPQATPSQPAGRPGPPNSEPPAGGRVTSPSPLWDVTRHAPSVPVANLAAVVSTSTKSGNAKDAGAAGAAGETAALSCASADVTRKKYVAPGVSPVSVRRVRGHERGRRRAARERAGGRAVVDTTGRRLVRSST